jgi:hypothetical protein
MFLKCVKVCMSWNKRNNRKKMHGATIKIILLESKKTLGTPRFRWEGQVNIDL